MNVSLYGTFAYSALYGIFQLWLGFYHHTFWFYSLGAYYICLAVMRFFLALHTRKYEPGENMRNELIKYRACGWVFLIMNLALSLIVFFMVYWNRTFHHHEITTIAMAAYTFTALTVAIINVVRYQKYGSPAYSAAKAISLASATVSMLTLENALLTTFGEGESELFRQIMLGASGTAVILVVQGIALYMIVNASKKLRIKDSET